MNAVARNDRISRDDLEAKFRELRGDLDTAKQSAQSYALAAGAVAVVAVVGIAYLLGKRKGKKKSAVVEIRRL